jgi:AcrR family transcriptional regulator
MDEIAARVGIAKGTVYLHFPCKEALVVAIFTRDMQRLLEGVNSVLEAEQAGPRASMEALIKFIYIRLYNRHAQLLSSIYSYGDLQRFFTAKDNNTHALWEAIIERITVLLEAGKAAGEFDASIPTKVMLAAFFGLFSPKSSVHFLIGETITPEEMATCMSRIFLTGIVPAGS